MNRLILLVIVIFINFIATGCSGVKAKNNLERVETVLDAGIDKDTKVQVAILLDTSGSMNGLIEQAKSRLWNIVNTLTTLKFKGRTPYIEIALYEYGNDGLSRSGNFIRQVTPLTNDLDLISEKLFTLTTNGGEEFCGAVIDRAVNELKWGNRESDMKLIYIAGNEPFTQGRISYKDAISGAVANHIYVNTIHCGDGSWGGRDSWKDGALRGKGKFFNIDHDAKVRYYITPYDDRISECNIRLNDTYISYTRVGVAQKANQIRQDENSKTISSANYAERAVSKTKAVYNNSKWDLVDKIKEEENALDKIDKSELSEELQGKSTEEIKTIVKEKEKERYELQAEISDLAKKRQMYIEEQMKKDNKNTEDDLGKAINQSVLDLALLKGYEVEK